MNAIPRTIIAATALAALLASSQAGRMPGEPSRMSRFLSALPTASITDVRIVGNLRWVVPDDLKRAIAEQLRGGFFRVDIAAVRDSALSVPWVRDVSVRRVWPGELHLTVVEDQPVARWAGGWLVTDRGTLLPARSAASAIGLPVFEGPREDIPRVREGLRELSAIFDGIGGGIARLERSAAGNWKLQFADGVRLVFRDDQQRHVRRFAAVYLSALIGRRDSIERIDLRYPNGFAVQWRNGADVHSRVQG